LPKGTGMICLPQELWYLLIWTNFEDFHRQKLWSGESVDFNRCVVHVKKR
jgi:hypothetical protein